MEVVEKSVDKLVLRMDISDSLANAIRRSAEEIPMLAVDEVEIFKNDSALYDEFLAHRIGLVPLKMQSKFTAKSNINLKLVKNKEGVVYSGDLKGGASVVFDKIPLTILRKGQEIELVATARLGTGLEHAKYSPGLCYYRRLCEVNSGNANVAKIVEGSKGMIKPEKKGSAWTCDLSEAEVDEITKLDKEAVKDSKELLFFVESFGQIDAKDIVSKAIGVLGENLKGFEKAIK